MNRDRISLSFLACKGPNGGWQKPLEAGI